MNYAETDSYLRLGFTLAQMENADRICNVYF